MRMVFITRQRPDDVSVLNREPMWLKCDDSATIALYAILFQCSTVSRCG